MKLAFNEIIMSRNLIILIVFFILLSCSRQEKIISEKISFSDFGEPIALKAEAVTIKDSIYSPYQIMVIDSLLITLERESNNLVKIYNINSGDLVFDGIPIGNGPNEVISAYICPSYNNYFCLYEKSKNEILVYNTGNLINQKGIDPISRIVLSEQSSDVEMVSAKKIIGKNIYDTKFKFNFYDSTGILIKKNGSYFPFKKDCSDQELIQGLECRFVTDFSNRIFVSHFLTDIIEIFDLNGTLIKRFQGPDFFYPDVNEKHIGKSSYVSPKRGSKDAYMNPVRAGNEVFVQYIGKAFTPDNPHLYNKIFVFNWDGVPQKQYILDMPTPFFDVDYKNRIIYGIAINPDYVLVKYKY